jgi:capsular exopolysaccharide synthesis family protein
MNSAQRDTTLADYLRVLRTRWWLILLIAIVCGGGALAYSLVAKKEYDATSSVSVTDPNQALSVLGSAAITSETPLQLASIHQPEVTRPAVLARVKAALASPLTTTQLKNAVTVGINPNSYLVTIDAQSRSATQAAAIANAFASADASLSTAAARAQYAAQAQQLSTRMKQLPKNTDPTTKLSYENKLSELSSLASIATPIQVSSTATVPSAASSPKPVKDTAAALIFGLLLGVAIAYARHALDRRLRRASDVEQQFEHPVIGRIRREALGHAGDLPGPSGSLAPIDAEAFRILRHNVSYLAAGEGIRTLAVTSAMAQEGKSTVAACLATASAEAGKRTMLIECDLRRPVLADRFGLAAKPGLTDYLAGQANPQEIMQLIAAPAPSLNGASTEVLSPAPLVCITSGTPPPRPADLLSSERFRAFVSEVSQAYELVVLDCAPLLSVADTLEVIPSASAILLCVRLRQTTREQARSVRAALDRLPALPTGIVLTDVRQNEDDYYGYYQSDYADQPVAAG